MILQVIRQMLIRLAFVATAMAVGVAGGFARADDLDRLRAEYPAAAAKLEQAYSHVTIFASETVEDERGEFRIEADCQLLREGNLVRGTQTVVRSAKPEFPPGAIFASATCGDSSFNIFKASPSNAFRFLFFGHRKGGGESDYGNYEPLFCPYMALTWRILDILNQKEKDLTITSAGPTSWDGQPAVDVIATRAISNHSQLTNHFYFLPHTWALAGWVITLPIPVTTPPCALVGHISYEPGSNPPIVKGFDKWWQGSDGKKLNGEHWDINEVTFGLIDPKEFDISAFGVAPPSDRAITEPASAPSGTTTQPSQ